MAILSEIMACLAQIMDFVSRFIKFPPQIMASVSQIMTFLLELPPKKQINLTPKSAIREMYTKAPFFIDFRVYLFNVTNKDVVQTGGEFSSHFRFLNLHSLDTRSFHQENRESIKLVPTFSSKSSICLVNRHFADRESPSNREWKEKFDLVDDEDEDTLTYNYKNTYIFRKDLSGPGLTGDEIITMANPCESPPPRVCSALMIAFNVFSHHGHGDGCQRGQEANVASG